MTHLPLRLFCLPCLTALCSLIALSSHASTTSASSATSSASNAIGSASESIERSSTTSSGGTHTAQGDYTLVEVAVLAERPGQVRLTLQALNRPGTAGELVLNLPEQTVATAALTTGQQITARQRPYGVEFTLGSAQQPFFLVLNDEWYRELSANAVTL